MQQHAAQGVPYSSANSFGLNNFASHNADENVIDKKTRNPIMNHDKLKIRGSTQL